MSRGWIIGGLLVALAVLALIFVAGQQRTGRVAAYRAALEQFNGEVVRLNTPIAQAFAANVTPSLEMIDKSRADLSTIRAEFDALGPPPDELIGAHVALAEALQQFQSGYDRLADNLATGVEAPFDADFITSVTHAGESIHLAARELYTSSGAGLCTGLRRLAPECWLWP